MSLSALIRRNLFYPLWTFKDRSNQLKLFKKFEHLQWLDQQELEKIQFENLKRIIVHAYYNTSYYNQLFDDVKFDPSKFVAPTQIKQIPILTKEQIQTKINEIVSRGYKKESLIKFQTGGSTGKSLTVYSDRNRLERALASTYMCFKWAGWNIGEPIGRIWGNPPLAKNLKEKLRNLVIQPYIWLDTIDLNKASMLEFVKKWEKIKPTLLHGHSHSLFEFSKYLKGKKIKLRPKGIISTSMMLLPSERSVIEDAFEIKVTDLYGCEEVGLIACECNRHEGMHLNIMNLFIEFIKKDGSIAMPGEEGDIVITSLTNYGMPLIRYRIEDIGIPSAHRCSCGRGLPLMQKVTGRVADFLVKEDGGLVAGVSLIERTLTKIIGLSQIQIIQKEVNNFHLNIVRNENYNEKSRFELIREFKKVFGNKTNLHIHLVDKIKQEKSGKYRFSICKVDHEFF
jgi:phenylacetate-CoA ligase